MTEMGQAQSHPRGSVVTRGALGLGRVGHACDRMIYNPTVYKNLELIYKKEGGS